MVKVESRLNARPDSGASTPDLSCLAKMFHIVPKIKENNFGKSTEYVTNELKQLA